MPFEITYAVPVVFPCKKRDLGTYMSTSYRSQRQLSKHGSFLTYKRQYVLGQI